MQSICEFLPEVWLVAVVLRLLIWTRCCWNACSWRVLLRELGAAAAPGQHTRQGAPRRAALERVWHQDRSAPSHAPHCPSRHPCMWAVVDCLANKKVPPRSCLTHKASCAHEGYCRLSNRTCVCMWHATGLPLSMSDSNLLPVCTCRFSLHLACIRQL